VLAFEPAWDSLLRYSHELCSPRFSHWSHGTALLHRSLDQRGSYKRLATYSGGLQTAYLLWRHRLQECCMRLRCLGTRAGGREDVGIDSVDAVAPPSTAPIMGRSLMAVVRDFHAKTVRGVMDDNRT
jgi:hypothetical protein